MRSLTISIALILCIIFLLGITDAPTDPPTDKSNENEDVVCMLLCQLGELGCVFVVKAGAISLCIQLKRILQLMIGGEASVPSELREYTAARPNLIKFLMGSSVLNIQCQIYY